MSTYPNIDAFNEACGVILEALYARFPEPAVLRAPELVATLPPEFAPLGAEAAARLYAATVEFLAEEGLIRYQSRHPGGQAWSQVVLAARGLAALSRTPEALRGPSAPLGERLKPALLDAGRETLRAVVRAIIETAAKGAHETRATRSAGVSPAFLDSTQHRTADQTNEQAGSLRYKCLRYRGQRSIPNRCAARRRQTRVKAMPNSMNAAGVIVMSSRVDPNSSRNR